MLITRILGGTAAALAGLALSAQAETWDMPTPYPDATFHTVNITEFAADVAAATDGALDIKVHSAASLFKHSQDSQEVLLPA